MPRLSSTLRRCLLALLLVALVTTPSGVFALDDHETPGLQKELLADLDQLEQKITGLAEAIPADKYSWAPNEGVRSVSEALMHTATANYFFGTMLDVAAPEGVDLRALEEVTDKAEAMKLLEGSFANLRKAIQGASDLEAAKSYFGQDGTVAGLLHAALSHNHEHLGQLIAYARANGVKPPWS